VILNALTVTLSITVNCNLIIAFGERDGPSVGPMRVDTPRFQITGWRVEGLEMKQENGRTEDKETTEQSMRRDSMQ
jgi:hypothetical protein